MPRQSGIVSHTYSELIIDQKWQPELALQGLEGYSHVWLIFLFHLNSSARYHAKVHPPRLQGETMGLFATRSPHRPNPLGLSLVEVIKVEPDRVFFSGADIVDGTPILDIKPYLPMYESIPSACAGWAGDMKPLDIKVEFSEKAESDLKNWISKSGRSELKSVIENIIKQDPRPIVYRGFEESQSPYRNQHAFRIYDGDIKFEFTSAKNARVIEIQFGL